MIERIVNHHLAVHFDRQSPGLCEVGIADVVLRSGAVGPSQISRPPVARGARGGRNEQAQRSERSGCSLLLVAATVTRAVLLLLAAAVVARLLSTLALRLEAAAANKVGLIFHQAGKIETEPIDPALQVVVEHVGDHGHSPPHPLAGATKFGVIELGHAAVTANHRLQHAHHGVRAEPMSLGYFFDQLLAGGGKLSHGDPPIVSSDIDYINCSAPAQCRAGQFSEETRKSGNVAAEQFSAPARDDRGTGCAVSRQAPATDRQFPDLTLRGPTSDENRLGGALPATACSYSGDYR